MEIIEIACDLASKIRALNPGSCICVQDIGEYVINTGFSAIEELVLPVGHTVLQDGIYPCVEHNGVRFQCLDTFQVMAMM